MKLTSTFIAVTAFAAVLVAAAPEAEAEARRGGRIGHCGTPGTPCWKRDAEAEAEARRGGRIGHCGTPGTPCWKREASADPDAKKHPKGMIGYCGTPGTPCWQRREAEAEARKGGRIGYCGTPGTPCWRRREAEAEAEAGAEANAEPNAEARRGGRIGHCGTPGTPCWKRDASPDAEPIGHAVGACGTPGNPCFTVKRAAVAIADALADAEAGKGRLVALAKAAARKHHRKLSPVEKAIRKHRKQAQRKKHRKNRKGNRKVKGHPAGMLGHCGTPGTTCFKVRRALDNIQESAEDAFTTIYEREAAAEAEADPNADPEAKPKHRGGRIGYCGTPGTPCWKRNAEAEADARRGGRIGHCGTPGTPCWKTRSVDVFEDDKADCFEEGNECDTLLKVRDAISEVKREAEAARKADPDTRLGYCSRNGGAFCGFLNYAHGYAEKFNKSSADLAKRECEDGLCARADASFDALEATIDEAVAGLETLDEQDEEDEDEGEGEDEE